MPKVAAKPCRLTVEAVTAALTAILEEAFVRLEQPWLDDFIRDKVGGSYRKSADQLVTPVALREWAASFAFQQGSRERSRRGWYRRSR